MSDEDEIAAYIARRGVTKGPTLTARGASGRSPFEEARNELLSLQRTGVSMKGGRKTKNLDRSRHREHRAALGDKGE